MGFEWGSSPSQILKKYKICSNIQALKVMEALNNLEDITELGNHLLDLPVAPRLGKMILYSVALKCLDPVLTIVACLSHK